MTLAELQAENERLENELAEMKKMMYSVKPNPTTYEKVRKLIAEKVDCLLPVEQSIEFDRRKLRRRIMDDLKWVLGVRYVGQLDEIHLDPAKEFISGYKLRKEAS